MAKSKKRITHDRIKRFANSEWSEVIAPALVPYIDTFEMKNESLYIKFVDVRVGAPIAVNLVKNNNKIIVIAGGWPTEYETEDEVRQFLLACLPLDEKWNYLFIK